MKKVKNNPYNKIIPIYGRFVNCCGKTFREHFVKKNCPEGQFRVVYLMMVGCPLVPGV